MNKDDLDSVEAQLTKEVPNLLEIMNKSSEEVNIFERKTSDAQGRYRKLLEQWSRLYEDLRLQYGSSIDRVKPYFDASQAASSASQRVQEAVREFSAAASQHAQAKTELRAIETRLAYGAHKVQLDGHQQDGLSRATVRVLKCQQERDRCEQDSAKALREYQDAQEALEGLRAQIGDFTIKRTLPCFRQLQQHQQMLATVQQRINFFTERAQAAKNAYKNSLAELDRINIAVHEARKKALSNPSSQAQRSNPEDSPEAAPEVTSCRDAHDNEHDILEPTLSTAQAVFSSIEDERVVTFHKVQPSQHSSSHLLVDDSPFS
jgi:SH3-domain binding protein 5